MSLFYCPVCHQNYGPHGACPDCGEAGSRIHSIMETTTPPTPSEPPQDLSNEQLADWVKDRWTPLVELTKISPQQTINVLAQRAIDRYQQIEKFLRATPQPVLEREDASRMDWLEKFFSTSDRLSNGENWNAFMDAVYNNGFRLSIDEWLESVSGNPPVPPVCAPGVEDGRFYSKAYEKLAERCDVLEDENEKLKARAPVCAPWDAGKEGLAYVFNALKLLHTQAKDFYEHTVDQGWVFDNDESEGITLLKTAIDEAWNAIAMEEAPAPPSVRAPMKAGVEGEEIVKAANECFDIIGDKKWSEESCRASIARFVEIISKHRSAPLVPDGGEAVLREAWEAGFALCKSYGDNRHHWDGEQKERTWQKFLASRAALKPHAKGTKL